MDNVMIMMIFFEKINVSNPISETHELLETDRADGIIFWNME